MNTVLNICIMFCGIIILGNSYSVFATYYYEKQREEEKEKLKRRLKAMNMIRDPIDQKLKNLSLNDFIYYEKHQKSKAATLAYSLQIGTKEMEDFSFKLDYYWFCKVDLGKFKNEILNLWDDFFALLGKNTISDLKPELTQLCLLTYHAGFNRSNKERLDDKLNRVVQNHFSKLLKELDFVHSINEIIDWYHYKKDYYYPVMEIGSTEQELNFLERIFGRYETELEVLKSSSPRTFLEYSRIVYFYCISLPKVLDRNYNNFYRYIMLNRIAVLKNIGEYRQFSESIYMFYRGQKNKKKGLSLFLDNLLDYGTGYGEKPSRLIILFICLEFVFLFIFYPYPNTYIKLNGINPENNLFENIIDVIYFNTTTLLTNYYGNITPEHWLARLIVTFELIIGFVVTGSFIALFLRKIFRH